MNVLNINDSWIRETISEECRQEYVKFFVKQPEELVQEFCRGTSIRAMILLGVVFVMWLLEPKLKKFVADKDYGNTLLRIYKGIGLGMIFIAGLAMYYGV